MVSNRLTLSKERKREVLRFSERGVREVEHHRLRSLLDRVNWEDLQIIHLAAEAASLRKTAEQTRLAVSTVRARLARLEEALGTTLFVRGRDGLKTTAEGRVVLDIVREMRSLGKSLPDGRGNNALISEDEIRISATEGVSTFWLTPRLIELRATLKDRIVTLDSFADQNQFSPSLYDISIGFNRPQDNDAVVTKLATVHIIPFASEQYLSQFGTPHTLDELSGHHYVQQSAPGLNNDALTLFFARDMLKDFVTIRVSSSYSLFWAVASGSGIGVLPTYVRALSRRVIPIDLPVQLKFELWASYDQAYRHSTSIRTTMDWLRTVFDPVRYPWFADHFVHPREFGELTGDCQVIPLFDHLIDDSL